MSKRRHSELESDEVPVKPKCPRQIDVVRVAKLPVYISCPVKRYYCPKCGQLLTTPVTLLCGHTMCMKCITSRRKCALCSSVPPPELHVNIILQEIINILSKLRSKKAIETEESSRMADSDDYIVADCGNNAKESKEDQWMKIKEEFDIGEKENASPRRPMLDDDTSEVVPIPANVWLKQFECVLCMSTLWNALCTPCGHTYCRACLATLVHYTIKCPLCQRDLPLSTIETTKETEVIQESLEETKAPAAQVFGSQDSIYICACAVVFPSMPCQLMFTAEYKEMIYQVTSATNRYMGIVPKFQAREPNIIGTIIQVRDCIQLEDGQFIITALGVTRFQIVRKEDGYGARIEPYTDLINGKNSLSELYTLNTSVYLRAKYWLHVELDEWQRSRVYSEYGELPDLEWSTDLDEIDGPKWVWWLIAVLPLGPTMQNLFLAAQTLEVRLKALNQTLLMFMLNFDGFVTNHS